MKKIKKHYISKSKNISVDPLDLVNEKLQYYPKKAKYIQIERTVLENLLNEYELTKEELENIKNDTG